MSEVSTALEIRFSANRLNDGAGDPYWIDLTLEEARRLHAQLAARLDEAAGRFAAVASRETFVLG
jgi:hypothetical protein